MDADIEQELIKRVRSLPRDKQQEALRLLETLADGFASKARGPDQRRRPLWEVAETINAQLPEDTWDQVPADGSINFDHYLYGAPKRQP